MIHYGVNRASILLSDVHADVLAWEHSDLREVFRDLVSDLLSMRRASAIDTTWTKGLAWSDRFDEYLAVGVTSPEDSWGNHGADALAAEGGDLLPTEHLVEPYFDYMRKVALAHACTVAIWKARLEQWPIFDNDDDGGSRGRQTRKQFVETITCLHDKIRLEPPKNDRGESDDDTMASPALPRPSQERWRRTLSHTHTHKRQLPAATVPLTTRSLSTPSPSTKTGRLLDRIIWVLVCAERTKLASLDILSILVKGARHGLKALAANTRWVRCSDDPPLAAFPAAVKAIESLDVMIPGVLPVRSGRRLVPQWVPSEMVLQSFLGRCSAKTPSPPRCL